MFVVINVLVVYCVGVASCADDFPVWRTDKFSLFPQLPVAFPWSDDPQCRKDSQLVISHLENQTLWAVQNSKGQQLLMAFSLKKNLMGFFKREGDPTPLDFLYGVKFVTIAMIIIDHRMAIFMGSPVFNYQTIEKELRGFSNLFLPHGDLHVDTFFYIAGLLSAYLALQLYSKTFINPLLLVLSRFIRIMPLYLFLIWFYASAMMRLGSGLGWRVVLGEDSLFCQQYWWTNVLFLNNYIHPEKMCMLQGWFLACDFHYFVCCIVLVLILVKSPRFGRALLCFLLVVFTIVPAVIVYINNLKPNVIYYNEFLSRPREDETFLQIYIKTHTRAAVYIIGILCGHILFTHQNSPKKISYRVSVLLCLVGLAVLFAPMAYGSQLYYPGRPYNAIEASLFATLRRIIWAAGCTVLMFTHRFGQIPLIGPLFETHTMKVLSKLSYSAYLVHFVMQVADYSKTKTANQFIAYELLNKGLYDVASALFVGLVMHLLIERPTRIAFKVLIFSRDGDTRTPPILPESITSKQDILAPTKINNDSPVDLHTVKL